MSRSIDLQWGPKLEPFFFVSMMLLGASPREGLKVKFNFLV